MKRLLLASSFFLLTFLQAAAQMPARAFISWEDFVAEYFSELTFDEENTAVQEDLFNRLDALRTAPIDINAADRNDLLRIPFLTEAQADSILVYRDRKRGMLSLGELIFIPELSYNDRRRLSLFVFCGERQHANDSIRRREARRGKHRIETRLDVPLYKRDGYRMKSAEALAENPNSIYLGNNLHHVLRYRYRNDVLTLGATFEKDSGEPFGHYDTYPYDYNSLFLHYRSKRKPWELLAGDFNLHVGQGLLIGSGLFFGRTAAVEAGIRPKTVLRGHSSTNEANFFRGAAVRFQPQNFDFLFFASYRRLDARMEDGKVTSLLSDGLHRTFRERSRRHNLGNLTVGGRASYGRKRWEAGVNAFYTRYEHEIAPTPHSYNKYYMRGRDAAGLSADYRFAQRRWSISGEVAFDKRFHIASTHTFRYEFDNRNALHAQWRSFSPRNVAPYGMTMQQTSRVSNEHGLLLGGTWSPAKRWHLLAYADLFRLPQPSFRACRAANGMEISAQMNYANERSGAWMLRYRVKMRQQNVSDVENLLEYKTTHRVRAQYRHEFAKGTISAAADFTAAQSQTAAPSLGWMLSTRGSISPCSQFSLAASASVFFTDDYASAVYAYEPQQPGVFLFPKFYDRGLSSVLSATWKPCRFARLALRYRLLHYFNRSEMGSGLQRLASASANDLSIYLCLMF